MAQTVAAPAAQGAEGIGPGTVPVVAAGAVTPAFRAGIEAALSDEDAALGVFYGARGFAPLWTGPDDRDRRVALLAALASASVHGLPRARHDPRPLRERLARIATEADRAEAELAFARAFIAFAHDAGSGVIDPGQAGAGLVREVVRPDPADLLAAFAAADDPAGYLRALHPQTEEYARLLRARLELAAVVARGGYGAPVTAGETIRPGDSGPAVEALRSRLSALGYPSAPAASQGDPAPVTAEGAPSAPELAPDLAPDLAPELAPDLVAAYDDTLLAAVEAFQTDHGLNPDGAVGERTLELVNLSAEERLASVTVALERERWLNFELGARHIRVQLADFRVDIVDDGVVTFSTRAVVGAMLKAKNTPEFSDEMTYMELNPDWTVPTGIIKRDYLPQLQSNPEALGHLVLIDSGGRIVPREGIDFSAYTASTFPYTLRQAPGDSNALGLVKFMFPNPHAIYLHDTPEKHLFVRDRRTYSSGCVRLAEPFEFAYRLLERQEADPKGVFDRALATGRQSRIRLAEPVPIHIDYRTAFFGDGLRLRFRADVYGRDRAIHEALTRAGVESPAPGG